MSTDIVKAEQPKPPILLKNGKTNIENIDQAFRMAKVLVHAGWTKMNEAQAVAAIMHGASIGLNPFQAVQGIAIINSRPTVWGDAAMAVIHASGELESCKVTEIGKGDDWGYQVEVNRKGVDSTTVSTFTIADAKKAGLWGKAGPWTQYPKRMLQLRARAYAMRDAFADKLQGVYIREEIDDYSEPVKVENTAEPQPDPLADVPIVKHEDDADFVEGVLEVMNGEKR